MPMFGLARCIPRMLVLVLASLLLALPSRHTTNVIVVRAVDIGAIGSSDSGANNDPPKDVHTDSSPERGHTGSSSSLAATRGGDRFGERRRRWLRRISPSSRMGTTTSAEAEADAKSNSNMVEEEEGHPGFFPKVFSAIVSTTPPSPTPETSTAGDGEGGGMTNHDGDGPGPGVVNFLSEVDLMYATTERDDDEGVADGTKIFFMIHSHRELHHLRSVANATNIGAFGSGSGGGSTKQGLVVDASSFRLDARRTEELQAAVANVRRGRDGNSRARVVIEEEDDLGTAEEGGVQVPRYSTIPGHPCFRDLDGMNAFLRDLNGTTATAGEQEEGKPSGGPIVTVRDIGDSYLKTQDASRGHDILAINITGSGNNGMMTMASTSNHDDGATSNDSTKATFLALFGVHAREYAPPELGARFAEMLIRGYGRDATITSTLDRTEIHLILHVNPDGREVAERGVMHRKNVHDYSEIKTCDEVDVGVDLNRNFPFKWGIYTGSSSDPCSHKYRGPYPASEPETRAVMDYAKSIFPVGQRMVVDELALSEAYDEKSTSGVFFDVHGPGGLNLYPFSFEERTFPDGDVLRTIARKLKRYNGHKIVDFWYEASGTTGDWSYATLGAATQIFEIGTDEFEECESFEHDVMSGNLEALLYATRLARAPYSMARGPDVIDVALSSTSVDIGVDVGSILRVSVDVEVGSSTSTSSSEERGGGRSSTFVVMLFVDVHPYDDDMPVVSSAGLSMQQTSNNDTTFLSSRERQAGMEVEVVTTTGDDSANTRTVNISMSSARLLSLLRGSTVGRHVMNVMGVDNDTGNAGPVKSVYFDVYNSTSEEGRPRDEWTVLTSDHFEFGWGNWSRDGKYARRYVGSDHGNGGYAPAGTAAIELRGGDFGTDTSSAVGHRHDLDVSGFVQLRMTFSFYLRKFRKRDEFFLELSNDGGESWGAVVKSWRHGEDIESDHLYEDEVVLMNSTVYGFTDTVRLRFRSGAGRKKEHVYIDDVELAGR